MDKNKSDLRDLLYLTAVLAAAISLGSFLFRIAVPTVEMAAKILNTEMIRK
jgi:hypothetical protein